MSRPRKGDDEPCPAGHVGDFRWVVGRRTGHVRRHCRTCERAWVAAAAGVVRAEAADQPPEWAIREACEAARLVYLGGDEDGVAEWITEAAWEIAGTR